MFWKLLKYEFKNVNKWYLSLYGAILFMSAILGFSLIDVQNKIEERLSTMGYYAYSSVRMENIVIGIYNFIFFGLFLTLAISTLILIISRFKNSVYGRQGYLTLTLPVNQHQIILSKLTGAMIWFLISSLTFFLAFLVIITFFVASNTISPFQYFFDFLYSLDFLLGLGAYITSAASVILLIYLSISIGQLFNNYRMTIAIVAYCAISIVLFIITSLTWWSFTDIRQYFIIGIINHLIQAILYYIGTQYILKNKVNLQ